MSTGKPPRAERSGDWKDLHLWQIQPIRDVLLILAVFGVVYLGYALSLVTVPILLALLLAYLFEPLVAWVTARTRAVSRSGVAIAIIVLAGMMVVTPLVVGLTFGAMQGAKLLQGVATNAQFLVQSVDKPADPAARELLPPGTWREIRDYIVDQEKLVEARRARVNSPEAPPAPAPDDAQGDKKPPPPAELDQPSPIFELLQAGVSWARSNAGRLGQIGLQWVETGARSAASFFGSAWSIGFGLFLTAFFFFFFCSGYGKVLEFWRSLIPHKRRGRVLDLLDKMDRVIAGFVRGRLTICVILMVVYSVGYAAVGVPAPLILGPIVGILTIIPYAQGVGIPVAILLMALAPESGVDSSAFTGAARAAAEASWRSAWWWIVGGPLLVHGTAQLLDDYLLTPKIQGKSTGMDTPSILFASLAGGVLMGVYGLLLAIPVAACLKILMQEVFWPRFKQWAEGRAKDFLPIEPG